MAITINRDKRNMIAAYFLLIYGCILIPACLVSFRHDAFAVNVFAVILMSAVFSLIISMLFYNLKMTLRFPFRLFVYWLIITGINVFIWLAICEGTFYLKE
ncbi:MAG: hypothetical protein JNL47_05065 [Bacteroidia bacterium]|nr:hypothetical protein [Bacteroidia bacterium]